MKKTIFNAIINAIDSTANAQLDNTVKYRTLSDDEIKALSQVHFFFDELKVRERDSVCKRACKRVSFNATQLVLNKTFAVVFADDDVASCKREMLASKNYCNANIVIASDADVDTLYKSILERVRNAYYESVAQALENAIDVVFVEQITEQTTQVTKKSNKRNKRNA